MLKSSSPGYRRFKFFHNVFAKCYKLLRVIRVRLQWKFAVMLNENFPFISFSNRWKCSQFDYVNKFIQGMADTFHISLSFGMWSASKWSLNFVQVVMWEVNIILCLNSYPLFVCFHLSCSQAYNTNLIIVCSSLKTSWKTKFHFALITFVAPLT